MIRRADVNDIPELMSLSRKFYEEMDFDSAGYHFDAETISKNFNHAVKNPGTFIFLVSANNAVIDGMLFCVIQDTTLYFKGHRFAQEVAWHSDPQAKPFIRGRIMLSLLKAAEKEMKERGNMPFYLSTDLRDKFAGVGRYLEKHGYTEMCRYWCKVGPT